MGCLRILSRSFIVACFLMMTLSVAGQDGIKWENGTFSDALAKAKEAAKPVFLDCYTSWCGPCKMMTNEVFTTKQAGGYFNANFVNVSMDMEKGEGIGLAKKYGVSAYPTFIIIDCEGNETGRVIGADSIENFIEKVEKARSTSLKVLLDNYLNTKDINLLPQYLGAQKKNHNIGAIRDFFYKYFEQIPEKDRYTFLLWEYLGAAITLDNTVILEYILENRTAYNRSLSKDVVDKAIINSLYNDMTEYLYSKKDYTLDKISYAVNIMRLLCGEAERFQLLISEVAMAQAEGAADKIVRMLSAQNIVFAFPVGQGVTAQSLLVTNKLVPGEAKEAYVKRLVELLNLFKRDFGHLPE